ncbi:universal stress protein [Fimbriiglobus ruber]|uniref:Universal stress protein n=1 Tax=Fimbriiglobus ruber TaxID=1908690 RepID=A0A225DQM3_9BACT|nr:universal stress protein [Fimbriiglobus ruber]OWK43692.1 Universal stress protein [Fimbriiglobus ruber]
MIRIKKILYPTDFSSYSNQAYFHALGLAETYGASLIIVYVYSPSPGEPAAARARWRSQLEQIRPSNPKISVTHVLLDGDPATEIVRHAAEAGVDVIAIGTHGHNVVDKPNMGSVAEKVMRDAPCSVLVVKLPRGKRPLSEKTVREPAEAV